MLRNSRAYVTADGKAVRLAISREEPERPQPAIVCVAGDDWGKLFDTSVQALGDRCASLGYVAICPLFERHASAHFPSGLSDLADCVRLIRDRSQELAIDPDAIGALGYGCGAHLVGLLATEAGPHGRLIQAAATIAALCDLTRPHEQHYRLMRDAIESFMGVPYEGGEDLYETASPLFQVNEFSSPLLLVHGEQDDLVPVSQSEAMAAALAEVEVPAFLEILPGEGHHLSAGAWAKIEETLAAFFGTFLPYEP